MTINHSFLPLWEAHTRFEKGAYSIFAFATICGRLPENLTKENYCGKFQLIGQNTSLPLEREINEQYYLIISANGDRSEALRKSGLEEGVTTAAVKSCGGMKHQNRPPVS